MASAKKIELKEEYSRLLSENRDFVMTRFSGLNVAKISELRKSLRENNIPFKVIKNNIFIHALKERQDLSEFPVDSFQGPYGVAFTNQDMPVLAKKLKAFSETNEKFQVVSGVMESRFYDAAGIRDIANLPTKEQSLATLAAALNAPATQIASLVSQIMSSLARGIKAVGEKNG